MRELIWTGSYGSTSVDHICERAGVKKGSFYHFFESKLALALASLDHGWAEYSAQLALQESNMPPLERILTCLRDHRRDQRDLLERYGRVLGCPIHALGAEVATTDPAQLARMVFAISEGLLLHARMRNDLSPLDDLESAALLLLAATNEPALSAN